MLGNSDIHATAGLAYDFGAGEHRPMTLVFAKAKNESSIKEALLAGRTAVYRDKLLIGRKESLDPLYKASIDVLQNDLSLRGKGSAALQIRNRSDVPMELVSTAPNDDLTVPEKITVPAHRMVIFGIRAKQEKAGVQKEYRLPYTVKNLLVAPGKGLPVEIVVKVQYLSSK